MKTFIYSCILVSLFSIQLNGANAQLISRRNFEMMVDNNCFFELTCDENVHQGMDSKFTGTITKGGSGSYRFLHEKTILPEGVEGHLVFKARKNEVGGFVDVYFDNPASGDLTVKIDAQLPFIVTYIENPDRSRIPNVYIKISVDTTNNTGQPPYRVTGDGNNNPKLNLDEPIPSVINFDWQVVQRTKKGADDEKDGKPYNEVTYLFTSTGDYAAIKPPDKSFSVMVYSKKGHTWIFDDKKKTITVMNMPKTVGEGGAMGKELAEKIKKAPLAKDKHEDEFTITKTGKTKSLLGFTADEYEMKSNKVITSANAAKTGTMSLWYAKVPFDPVKIYTMGVGRPADISKIQNDPKMKNNMFSIPVLNKNYLWVETESGGIKGMETIEIKKVSNTIYTGGYKIKVINSFKDMMNDPDN
jgi:hypothetical protein